MQQGLQDTALSVWTHVCMEKSLVEVKDERKRYRKGDETSRDFTEPFKELLYPAIYEAKNYLDCAL